jgi:Septum formation
LATPRRCLLAVVAAGLLVSGCGGSTGKTATTASDPTPATTASSDTTRASHHVKAPPAAPAVGECRNLTYRDISVFYNDTQSTPCSESHTAYTFAVVRLSNRVAFNGVEIQNDAVQSAAADKCHAAFRKFIGGDDESRALARLTVTYFLPRQAGFNLGAHWVRCDVVALKYPQVLASLPSSLQGFLDSSGALTTYGVCAHGKPGVSLLVMCSEPHRYRALAAIRLGGANAAYPGAQATVNLGTRRCQHLVAKQLGVSGGFTYTWTYPSTADWAAGQRFGYCWNETRS